MTKLFALTALAVVLLSPPAFSASPIDETVTPPSTLSIQHQKEYNWGIISGWLLLCGNYSESREIATVMSLSPYFDKGKKRMSNFDLGGNCGRASQRLKEWKQHKDGWVKYMSSYPKVD